MGFAAQVNSYKRFLLSENPISSIGSTWFGSAATSGQEIRSLRASPLSGARHEVGREGLKFSSRRTRDRIDALDGEGLFRLEALRSTTQLLQSRREGLNDRLARQQAELQNCCRETDGSGTAVSSCVEFGGRLVDSASQALNQTQCTFGKKSDPAIAPYDIGERRAMCVRKGMRRPRHARDHRYRSVEAASPNFSAR